MKILFLTKFPPLQGGMSGRGFFLAQALAGRGHQVDVVTNALQAEDHERVPGPLGALYRKLAAGVRVTFAEDVDQVSYLRHPMGVPAASQLASLALARAEEIRPDVVFSAFMEPYGVAGYMVSSMLGLPHVFMHAGSDLGRLMGGRDSQHLHSRILRGSTVLTSWHHIGALSAFEVPADRLHPLPVPTPAWMGTEPPPAPTPGNRTVLVAGKLPPLAFLTDQASRCRDLDLTLRVVGRSPWPHRGDHTGVVEPRTEPYIWPWDMPGLLAECAAVVALEPPTVEIQGHLGLRAVEAWAAGRVAAVPARLKQNFTALDQYSPDSLESLSALCDEPERLERAGHAAHSWLTDTLHHRDRGFATFDGFCDVVEAVLTDPSAPHEDPRTAESRSLFLRTHAKYSPTPRPGSTQPLPGTTPVLRVMNRARRPRVPFTAHSQARVLRRQPMSAIALTSGRYEVLLHGVGLHRREFSLSARMFELVRRADGSLTVAELATDSADLARLERLWHTGVLALAPSDDPQETCPELIFADPAGRPGLTDASAAVEQRISGLAATTGARA